MGPKRVHLYLASGKHCSLLSFCVCICVSLTCRAGANWQRLALRAGGEGAVRDRCRVRHGARAPPHEQGPLCRLPGGLPRDGARGRQKAAQVHPQR